ncbi:hypothetical protein HOY82DRAFT_571328 [Tuber indicum]|nr:hypothetical protein HOY82DRAFT_571328 [Tuber indicum]
MIALRLISHLPAILPQSYTTPFLPSFLKSTNTCSRPRASPFLTARFPIAMSVPGDTSPIYITSKYRRTNSRSGA